MSQAVPASEAPAGVSSGPAASPAPADQNAAPAHQACIMVVEDEDKSRRYLEAVLTSFGYVVQLAVDGRDALDKMNPEVDLVLMDVMMPRLNGLEAVKELRANTRYAEIPVIMTTALSSKEDRLKAVEAGANDYVSKPIDSLELKLRIAALLKIKQAQDARRQLLRETVRGSIKVLADVLVLLRPEVYGRVAGMTPLLRQTSRLLGDPTPWFTEVACMLGQLGAVIHNEEVLRRMEDGDLQMDDQSLFAEQLALSSRLVAPIPRLEAVAEIIACQEKHFDGGGLPKNGRRGEDIPLGSRILKAVGDYSECISRGLEPHQALAELKGRIGLYDPRVLEGLKKAVGEQALYRVLQVRVGELRDGMLLDQDVEIERPGNHHLKLLAKGQEVNETVRAFLSAYHKRTPVAETLRVKVPIEDE